MKASLPASVRSAAGLLSRAALARCAAAARIPAHGVARVNGAGLSAHALDGLLSPAHPAACRALPWLAHSAPARCDIRTFMPQAQSVVVCAFPYASRLSGHSGVIARYACGDDYHACAAARLEELARMLREECGAFPYALSVDAAPVAERYWAVAAGLGWIGDNGCLITPAFGSWVVVGVLALPLEIESDTPLRPRCGACSLCRQHCPTGALAAARVCQVERCISYWTVEARQPLPADIRAALGQARFGCDRCQEVCPFNAVDCGAARLFAPRHELVTIRAADYERLPHAEFLAAVRGTPVARSARRGVRVHERDAGAFAPDPR